jgi:hypothetical protein
LVHAKAYFGKQRFWVASDTATGVTAMVGERYS